MPHQALTALLAVQGIIPGIYHALNNLRTKAIMQVGPHHAKISRTKTHTRTVTVASHCRVMAHMTNVIRRRPLRRPPLRHPLPGNTDTSKEPKAVTVLPLTVTFNTLRTMVTASPQMTKKPTNSTTCSHPLDRDPIHILEGRGHIDTLQKRVMMALSAKRRKTPNSANASTPRWLQHTGESQTPCFQPFFIY